MSRAGRPSPCSSSLSLLAGVRMRRGGDARWLGVAAVAAGVAAMALAAWRLDRG